MKGGVALDVEWNSKDQTFDRDLYAFRTFFEFGRSVLPC
ncbi:MAG: BglII/BstYI family type II restriction endonuclease [Terriglobales bacterium]